MVREIEPYVRTGLDLGEIEPVIHYMMVMNPKIEIYLLDEEGVILAYFAEPGLKIQMDRVEIEPIRAFLMDGVSIPLYGSDPRNPGEYKHFSAAPIGIGPDKAGYLYIVLRSSLYDRAARTLRERYIFSTINQSLLLSLLFVGIIGLILFAFLTKRLQHVSKAVMDFERGDYSSRIVMHARDEIGSLSRAFNQMASTINAHMEKLKRTDELRRELVANVSHDLKSPLATIQGYIETLLMKEEYLSHEERRRFLDIVLQTTRSLDTLVGELLELSKLDTKQVEPAFEVFSMSDLTQDVYMKFKPRADKNELRLTAHVPEQQCFVRADIGLIERVMSNLLDNAIKNTPPGGSVEMELSSHEERVRFLVRDSGRGIAPEDIPAVFERFYIVNRSRNHPEFGTGLGLAISKKIMELHASTIDVESRVGSGSTFSFELQAVPFVKS
jgi:signal transduction histidine kinase